MQGTSKVPVLCVYSVSYLVSFFGAIRENGDMITISVSQCCFLSRRSGDRIYEIRCLFVAVGPNARFIVLPHWDNMS